MDFCYNILDNLAVVYMANGNQLFVVVVVLVVVVAVVVVVVVVLDVIQIVVMNHWFFEFVNMVEAVDVVAMDNIISFLY